MVGVTYTEASAEVIKTKANRPLSGRLNQALGRAWLNYRRLAIVKSRYRVVKSMADAIGEKYSPPCSAW